MKEKEGVEENEEQEDRVHILSLSDILTHKQIQYSLKTENTPSLHSMLAVPFGGGGLVQFPYMLLEYKRLGYLGEYKEIVMIR